MACRRDAIPANRDASGGSDLRRHLGPGKHAAMARLCALAEFDFHHLDLRFIRLFGKLLRRKASVAIAAAEIAAADLPDDVAAMPLMVPTKPTLARVMRKSASLRSKIQSEDRV